MKIINIIKFSLSYKRLVVILKKFFLRFFDKKNSITESDLNIWLKKNEDSIPNFCSTLDKNLWSETRKEIEAILKISTENLKNIPHEKIQH